MQSAECMNKVFTQLNPKWLHVGLKIPVFVYQIGFNTKIDQPAAIIQHSRPFLTMNEAELQRSRRAFWAESKSALRYSSTALRRRTHKLFRFFLKFYLSIDCAQDDRFFLRRRFLFFITPQPPVTLSGVEEHSDIFRLRSGEEHTNYLGFFWNFICPSTTLRKTEFF